MTNVFCTTCETETEVKQTSHLARCGTCGDSEGLVFEDDDNYEQLIKDQNE